MGNFFGFEKLIAPTIIKIVYWLGLVAIIGGGIFATAQATQQQGGLGALVGIVGTLGGILLWRIICELYMVAFGVYERLGAIRDTLHARADTHR